MQRPLGLREIELIRSPNIFETDREYLHCNAHDLNSSDGESAQYLDHIANHTRRLVRRPQFLPRES